jgi:DNA-binding ferritin-like protein
MGMEKNKYERILHLLKKSRPVLNESDDIEERVINEIRKSTEKRHEDFNLLNYLFGWVYIGWVRSTLVTVSVFLVGLFIYQQSLILKRIENLENQTRAPGSQFVTFSPSGTVGKMTLDRLTTFRLKARRIHLSGKQLEELIESYNELDNKYKDLVRLIENDPELKKMLDEKLSEKNKKKFNL